MALSHLARKSVLEKVAVNAAQLSKAVQAAKKRGVIVRPPRRFLRKRSWGELFPRSSSSAPMAKQPIAVSANLKGAQGQKAFIRGSAQDFKQKGFQQGLYDKTRPLSPEAKALLGRQTALHETAEAGKHPGRFHYSAALSEDIARGSHASLKPPLQDLNIAATLTGKGSREAAEEIRKLRGREVDELEQIIPGLERLNLGKKRVSRHAQKRLQEAYERGLTRRIRQEEAIKNKMSGAPKRPLMERERSLANALRYRRNVREHLSPEERTKLRRLTQDALRGVPGAKSQRERLLVAAQERTGEPLTSMLQAYKSPASALLRKEESRQMANLRVNANVRARVKKLDRN